MKDITFGVNFYNKKVFSTREEANEYIAKFLEKYPDIGLEPHVVAILPDAMVMKEMESFSILREE